MLEENQSSYPSKRPQPKQGILTFSEDSVELEVMYDDALVIISELAYSHICDSIKIIYFYTQENGF